MKSMEELRSNRPYEVRADAAFSYEPIDVYSREKHAHKKQLVTAGLMDSVKGAIMEAEGSLPYFAEVYEISANINDYVLVPTIIMPSDLPNRNLVAFPREELLRANPELGTLGYQTWRMKHTCKDHCFPGDAPIKTPKGYKRIKKIKIGDTVITHTGREGVVTEVFNNGKKHLTKIKAYGFAEGIFATENHPIWVIDPRQLFNKIAPLNDGRHKNGYSFTERINDVDWDDLKPHFRDVSDLNVGDYLITPLTIGGDISVDKNVAFLTGVHMAEGCYEWDSNKKPRAIQLTIGYAEKEFRERIELACETLGFKTTIHHHKKNNATNIRIADRDFASYLLSLTGNLAHRKSMRGDLRKWNKKALLHFIGGYISGDGSVASYGASNQNLIRCRTASKRLAIDIQHTLAHLGVVSTVNNDGKAKSYTYFCHRYNTERRMNSKGSYCVSAFENSAYILNDYIVGKKQLATVKVDNAKSTKILIKGNYLLSPINEITRKVRYERVYNFEVEGDHTYVAYNAVVHNCNKRIPQDSKGIVLSTFLREMKGTRGNLLKVVALCAYDRKRDPILANSILTGERTTYSMGAFCGHYTCSICNARFPEHACEHIEIPSPKMKRRLELRAEADGRLAYLKARDFVGFEISSVESPAYVSARTEKEHLIKMFS